MTDRTGNEVSDWDSASSGGWAEASNVESYSQPSGHDAATYPQGPPRGPTPDEYGRDGRSSSNGGSYNAANNLPPGLRAFSDLPPLSAPPAFNPFAYPDTNNNVNNNNNHNTDLSSSKRNVVPVFGSATRFGQPPSPAGVHEPAAFGGVHGDFGQPPGASPLNSDGGWFDLSSYHNSMPLPPHGAPMGQHGSGSNPTGQSYGQSPTPVPYPSGQFHQVYSHSYCFTYVRFGASVLQLRLNTVSICIMILSAYAGESNVTNGRALIYPKKVISNATDRAKRQIGFGHPDNSRFGRTPDYGGDFLCLHGSHSTLFVPITANQCTHARIIIY